MITGGLKKRSNDCLVDLELGMSAQIRKRRVDSSDPGDDSEPLINRQSGRYSARKHRDKSDTSCFGKILKCLKITVILIFLSSIVLAAIYYFAPCSIEPQYYSLPDPPALVGPLEPNDRLVNVERFMEGELLGAESIVLDQDKIYATTHDGKIIYISKRKVERYFRLGKEPCGTFETEPTCGRPLGIRMNPHNNELLVADGYLGLFSVNMWTNSSELLVKGGTLVGGRPLKFINDVLVGPDGNILFTDSSSKWDRRHHLNIFLEGSPDGRLLSYNPLTKEIHVLVDSLYFANGIELTLDRQAVLITECSMARIHRYYLVGENQGQIEVFAQNLPGYPDNIRTASDGNIWVPISLVRHAGEFSIWDFLQDKPWLRRLMSQVASIQTMEAIKRFWPKYGLIVKLDQKGNIIESLHDPTGSTVSIVSEVADAGNFLYLGSYHPDYSYIAKVQS